MRPLPFPTSSTSPQRRAATSETRSSASRMTEARAVDKAAALGILRRLGMTAPGAAAGEGGGADRRQSLGAEGCGLFLGTLQDVAEPQHRLRDVEDVEAAGSRPPRQLGALADGGPGLPASGHPPALPRQVDQVVPEGGLQALRQVEPLLPGPAAEAVPVTEVGPLGVSGAGGLADLVGPG